MLNNCYLFNLFFNELKVLSLCWDMYKNDVELNIVHNINFNVHNYSMPIDSSEINWSSINPCGSVNVLTHLEVIMYLMGRSGTMSPDSSSYLSVDELSTLD